MTHHTHPSTVADRGPAEDFTTSEGLRTLLYRLDHDGPGTWARDPVARELMQYTADKYAALAVKHGLDPWEAATAAWEELRKQYTREANDPWAAVTHAVRKTCIAEERGQGLLCSTSKARRAHISAFHDAQRISDRETPLWEYHPAFHCTDDHHDDIEEDTSPASGCACISAGEAVEEAIRLCVALGWPAGIAKASIEHICAALINAESRRAAYERLRRDPDALALLGLTRGSWTGLLKALLGVQAPGMATTAAGRGVLLRLLDDPDPRLLADDDLVLTLHRAAPRPGEAR